MTDDDQYEIARKLGDGLWKLMEGLRESGFSRDEAFQIVMNTLNQPPSPSPDQLRTNQRMQDFIDRMIQQMGG